jgi:sec-independent protein translocase protein TatA
VNDEAQCALLRHEEEQVMPGMIGMQELLVILLVVLLLFGAKRIPEVMRSLGSGINEFKRGMRDIERDVSKEEPPRSGPRNGG